MPFNHILARVSLFVFLMLGVTATCATAQSDQKQGTGMISGRVTLDDKPISNLNVALFAVERGSERRAISRAMTDYEGRYWLANVPVSRYAVVAIAPAHGGPNEGSFGEPGRTVTIAEGETVEEIDFTLVRGGVITGRVTDVDGTPLRFNRINLKMVSVGR